MDEAKIQKLFDRMEITDVSTRYASGVDMKDRDLYRSCFTDEIVIDFSSTGLGEPMTMAADAWTDQALMMVGMYESTQHIISNFNISINGDEATSVAYVQAQHYNPDSLMTIGGYYSNKLVRTPDGWRIKELQLNQTWTKFS